ncbi:hypothetical protein IQ289_25325 [Burkholderia sp. R-70006]|uniref:hypothetical protein n=1 Tax=Paraburkholderia domus TaxID=2793075 RepID=UPI0019135CAD|nr:hypothetical protein [Paraburkholderia domus]MBK5051706.1 hypothetical protein [Burkholderia sp. R-70006]
MPAGERADVVRAAVDAARIQFDASGREAGKLPENKLPDGARKPGGGTNHPGTPEREGQLGVFRSPYSHSSWLVDIAERSSSGTLRWVALPFDDPRHKQAIQEARSGTGSNRILPVWTAGDCQAADRDGWNLFDVDGSGYHEIQRDDEANRFASDAEAIEFVQQQAKAGDAVAVKALKIHGTVVSDYVAEGSLQEPLVAGKLLHEITSNDVLAVLRVQALQVANSDGKPFDAMAELIFDGLDFSRLEKAALLAGADVAAQAVAVRDAIADQMVEEGVLKRKLPQMPQNADLEKQAHEAHAELAAAQDAWAQTHSEDHGAYRRLEAAREAADTADEALAQQKANAKPLEGGEPVRMEERIIEVARRHGIQNYQVHDRQLVAFVETLLAEQVYQPGELSESDAVDQQAALLATHQALAAAMQHAEAVEQQRDGLLADLRVIANQSLGDDWTATQAVSFAKRHARDAIQREGRGVSVAPNAPQSSVETSGPDLDM